MYNLSHIMLAFLWFNMTIPAV